MSAEGTNPLLPDKDGDGFSDRVEVDYGSNPLDPGSIPVLPLPILGPGGAALLAAALVLLAWGFRPRAQGRGTP